MRLEGIENFYEELVRERIQHLPDEVLAQGSGFLEDLACVALNQLPARYYRHAVDMAFYLSREERREMEEAVDGALARAVEYLNGHSQGARPRTFHQF